VQELYLESLVWNMNLLVLELIEKFAEKRVVLDYCPYYDNNRSEFIHIKKY